MNTGFCGHAWPVVKLQVKDAPTVTISREKERQELATKKGKKALNAVDLNDAAAWIDCPIFDGPALKLVWRLVGWDSLSEERVSKFFTDLGAAQRKDANLIGTLLNEDTASNATLEATPENLRLLRACDIVLTVPRTALNMAISIGTAAVDSVVMEQKLGLTTPQAGTKPTLSAVPLYTPVDTGDTKTQLLSGVYQEPTFDQWRIATVWALSPLNTKEGAAPDASWTAYSQHGHFWNFGWAQRVSQIKDAKPLQLTVPLAGGIAQPTVNLMLSTYNDAYEAVLNSVTSNSMKGGIWSV